MNRLGIQQAQFNPAHDAKADSGHGLPHASRPPAVPVHQGRHSGHRHDPPSCANAIARMARELRLRCLKRSLQSAANPAQADAALRKTLRLYSRLARPGEAIDPVMLDAVSACSPRLTALIAKLRQEGCPILAGEAGKGSYCLKPVNTIVIDLEELADPAKFLPALAHETGHALFDIAPDFSSKARFLCSRTMCEGIAAMNEFLVLAEAGPKRFPADYLDNRADMLDAYQRYLEDGDIEKAQRRCGEIIFERFHTRDARTGQLLTYAELDGACYDRYLSKLEQASQQYLTHIEAMSWIPRQARAESGWFHPDFPMSLIAQIDLLAAERQWMLARIGGGIDFTRQIVTLPPTIDLRSMRQVQHLAHQLGQALCGKDVDVSSQEAFVKSMLRKVGKGIVNEYLMREEIGAAAYALVGNNLPEDQPKFEKIFDAYCRKQNFTAACEDIGDCLMPADLVVSGAPVTYRQYYIDLYQRHYRETEKDGIALRDSSDG